MEIILGGGCFWCVETIYNKCIGVNSAISGYMGGHKLNPTYKDICNGDTGHAEVVKVDFNEELISLETILHIFWTVHDPTQLNRQGNDVGTQYRSCIFSTEDQNEKINNSIENIAKQYWSDEIKTIIYSANDHLFYPAEDYHQMYFDHNGGQPYCAAVINPKVAKFRKNFSALLKPTGPQYNKLNEEEAYVILHKGTERPFTGEYDKHFEKGKYICRQCNAELYTSEHKFNSGCGWPAFDDELPNAVKQVPDKDGRRVEIVCRNCDGHLGHIFHGERQTAKNTRHCVNSLSIRFVKE
jgi:methionine-S-sulfoxide reductase/methionine-R-sulfoxide reductase